jgi:hypothetical protein
MKTTGHGAVCIHCGGWNCARCTPPHAEHVSQALGETALTADELELHRMRRERNEAQAAAAQMERDLEKSDMAYLQAMQWYENARKTGAAAWERVKKYDEENTRLRALPTCGYCRTIRQAELKSTPVAHTQSPYVASDCHGGWHTFAAGESRCKCSRPADGGVPRGPELNVQVTPAEMLRKCRFCKAEHPESTMVGAGDIWQCGDLSGCERFRR